MKRAIAMIIAGVAALALAGCASLPTSGPVTTATPKEDAAAPLAQHAEGPRAGSTVAQLISDFQRACAAGTYDDFRAAKKYLTKNAASRWDPEESVSVLPEDPTKTVKATVNDDIQTVDLVGTILLAVDSYGREITTRTRYEQTLSVVQEDGEWRIDALPGGVTMSESAFTNAYTRRNVFFLSAVDGAPVADPRWIPRSELVTRLVAALYDGPSAALEPAVTSAFPIGVAGASPVVEVTDSLASVSVPTAIARLDDADRARALAQLAMTLHGVSGITSVELVSDQHVLTVGAQPVEVEFDLDYYVGLSEGAIVRFTDSHMDPLVSQASLAGQEVRWPTTGPVGDRPVVALSRGFDSIVTLNGSSRRTVWRGTALTRPSIDRFGYIWSSSTAPGGGLVVVDTLGHAQQVAFPWDPGDTLSRVIINSDGSRALITRHSEGRDVVEIYTIRREGETPVELANPQQIAQPTTAVADTSWLDATTAVVLAQASEPYVVIAAVNGIEDVLATPKSASYLVAGGSMEELQIVTGDGNRQEHVGSQWRTVGSGIADVSHAG